VLRDKIVESYNLLMKENDNIPLGIRGELEVIVRDRNGKIISYDKDHNEITDWMKHSIVHLLAGDIFSSELQNTNGTTSEKIYTKIQEGVGFHNNTGTKANGDGMLLTSSQYFHTGKETLDFGWGNSIPADSTGESGAFISPTFPTKMLFGTGKEIDDSVLISEVLGYYGALTDGTGDSLEKYMGEGIVGANLHNNIDNDTNYYSNTINESATPNVLKQCRTIQSNNFTNIETPSSWNPKVETGITGAIKDCLITDETTHESNFNSAIGMANSEKRGVGRPAFIYAERENQNFTTSEVVPGSINISNYTSSKYEDKITYSVIMPQNNQNEFYPYNGWIIKEAGLFSDSVLTKQGVISEVDDYFKMPCGILLAKRYIKPIMKTADTEIEFRWTIYIAD